MTFQTTTSQRKLTLETWLIVLTALSMLVSAGMLQSQPCACNEDQTPGAEWNMGVKDFFFKYPNL